MTARLQRAGRVVAGWLGTRMASRLVFALFVVEAVWFVCSARYPMAFDENYHYGLIQLHARQWLPFFTTQPHDAAVYGAVVRDPSYLYHWLMSYPYRLVRLFTHDQTAVIIVLRLLNVGLFTLGLALQRRIIRRIGASRALTNSLLAIFILIPVVPFLAAHINYDNLFFVAVPLTILLAMRLIRELRAGKLLAQTVLLLLSVLSLSCLIKYPFLPVCGVTGLFLLGYAWRRGMLGRSAVRSFAASFGTLTRYRQVALVLLVVVSMGLFAERYIANLATYHNPVPACDAVISQDECVQYGPYGRDHLYIQEKTADFHANPVGYLWQWLWGMWYRLFFAIGPDYATGPPLAIVAWSAALLAVLLGVGIVIRLRPLLAGQPMRQLIGWIVAGYVLVLFVDGFSSYKKTGQPVAINGRYLVAFLPLIMAFGGLAWAQLLRGRTALKGAIAGVVIAVFLLQGGGALTFLVRSNDSWIWGNGAVRAVNGTARSMVWPFIIGKGSY